MLPKVAALAARLQNRRQETLSVPEMEEIGAEVGLDPAFIRQALSELSETGPVAIREMPSRRTEFQSVVGALMLPLLWSVLSAVGVYAWSTRFPYSPDFHLFMHQHLTQVFLGSTFTVGAVGMALGLLAGKKKTGAVAGLLTVIASLPAVTQLFPLYSDPLSVLWALLMAPLTGFIGWQGARIREHYYPLPSAKQPVSRQEWLNLLFLLERRLELQKGHRTFLSLDVVASSEMKQSASELAVEYSFGEYRAWVEEIIRKHGGAVQIAAGDGVMGVFAAEASALRAARAFQEELARFNAERNRLPLPFRLRCGVSAGEVAVDENTPIGDLQSPVIDRAAALQKRAEPGDILVAGPLAASALVELGPMAPLPDPVAGEIAFSWRAGKR